MASLEKEKGALEEALAAARAEAKKNAEATEAVHQDARTAEEAKINAEKAKAKDNEARTLAEAARPREGKYTTMAQRHLHLLRFGVG